MKTILEMIRNMDSSDNDSRALLIGIIDLHKIECPREDCLAKENRKIYHPILNQWSQRSSHEINDKVFLDNFIVIILKYYIYENFFSADILINLSLYYLQNLGNYCKAIYYYRKLNDMRLSFEEEVSFKRVKYLLSVSIKHKLKKSFEGCSEIEDLNTKLFYVYETLSKRLVDEIRQDVIYTIEFWKSFKDHQENIREIDGNKIFKLSN